MDLAGNKIFVSFENGQFLTVSCILLFFNLVLEPKCRSFTFSSIICFLVRANVSDADSQEEHRDKNVPGKSRKFHS